MAVSIVAMRPLILLALSLACAGQTPRVLLIGDSISMGYTLPVQQLLNSVAEVQRIPMNGGPTTNGTAHLDEWLGVGKWAVIHFNFGLHDVKLMDSGELQVSIADYERNLREIVRKLKTTGARLIWATTTPVPGITENPSRNNRDVLEYNAVAKRVMDENGIPVNDLYGLVFPRLHGLQQPENVHFTQEGYSVLAEKVAASIRESLASSR